MDGTVYGLYCECANCLTGGPSIRYVGVTVRKLSQRLRAHLVESATSSHKAKDRWIRKHGSWNIRARVLESGLTSIEDLKKAEISHIAREKTYDSPHGLNMTRGGDGVWGYKHTDSTRAVFRERTARQMRVKHPRARIGESDVQDILARIWAGESAASISKDYPISASAIQKVRDGKNWTSVKRPDGEPKSPPSGNGGARRIPMEMKANIWDEHTGEAGENKRLSEKYAVCETTIHLIVSGKRGLPAKWKAVGE